MDEIKEAEAPAAEYSEPPEPPKFDAFEGPSETSLFTFLPGTNELAEFNTETGRTKKTECRARVFEDSAWCSIPGNSIFICGGGSKSGDREALRSASELTLDNNESREHELMWYYHGYHGAIYSGGNVYVLGGNDEFGVASANFELFSLKTS